MRQFCLILLFSSCAFSLLAGITATVTPAFSPKCKTGSITMEVSGGFEPYHFDWFGPDNFYASTKDIYSLYPGDYKVVVTDAFCGILQKTFKVGYQHEHLFYIKDFQNPESSSTCSGSVNIEPYESVWPYTYAWSNGATTQDVHSLCAGTYTVTITRNSGCTDVLNVVLVNCPSPAKPIEITNVDIKHAIPPNNNKGSIDISVKGPPTGSGPPPTRSYSWIGPNGFTSPMEDIANLTAGTYQLTVNDGCNKLTVSYSVYDCESSYTIRLSAIARPDNQWKEVPEKGSITLDVTGGIPPYSFAWDHSSIPNNTQNPTNLGARQYCVTVTDFCGKTATLCEKVAWCRFAGFRVEDNCSNDPKPKMVAGGGDHSWGTDDLNTIPTQSSASPTLCDKSITIMWPGGQVAYGVLDETELDDGVLYHSLPPFPYKYNKLTPNQSGWLCTKITDACGCETDFCDNVGGANSALVFKSFPLSLVVPYAPSDEVVTQCFSCSVCTGDVSVPPPSQMTEEMCDRDFTPSELLQYTNNNIARPCKGGAVKCPKDENFVFPVWDDLSGDLIIDWDAEPVYNPTNQTCVYPLGCLFSSGMIQGIDKPVYVKNPNGYQVPYQEGLCIKPITASDCPGQIIQDIGADVDSDCNIPLICLTQEGITIIGEISVATVCICNNHLVKICPANPGSGPYCKNIRLVAVL